MAEGKRFYWKIRGVMDENFPEYVPPRKSQQLLYRGPNGLEVVWQLKFYPEAIFVGPSTSAARQVTSSNVPKYFVVSLEVVRCNQAAIKAGFKIICNGPTDVKLTENTTDTMVSQEFDTDAPKKRIYEWRISMTFMRQIKDSIYRHSWNLPSKPNNSFLGQVSKFVFGPQSTREDLNIALKIFNVDIVEALNAPKCDTVNGLVDKFWSMYSEKKLVDMLLIVGEREFAVHKLVLAARSPVFAAMFDHDVAETEQNIVVISDFDAPTMQNFIQFLYTGRCDIRGYAAELLMCAEKYNVESLKSECEIDLIRQLKSSNAALILQLADVHSAARLKKATLKFVGKFTKEVMSTPQWASLSTELLNEVIQTVKRHQ